MRRVGRLPFSELVKQNKERLTQDQTEVNRLEERFEQKHALPK
ncbi:FbpB family small basic protein [Shouchella sp. 1P09AA]|nr:MULTISPECIES: FbpB family small basic protein [Bacillaceae]UTR04663.1 FbpB family small basic protein [Alkalihalobacillus sp. LMS6]